MKFRGLDGGVDLAGNKKDLAKEIQARLELYQLGKPYHAPAVK